MPQCYVKYLSLVHSLCYQTPSRMLTATPFANSPMLNHYMQSGCLNIHLKFSSILFTEVSTPARKKIILLFIPLSFFPFSFFYFPDGFYWVTWVCQQVDDSNFLAPLPRTVFMYSNLHLCFVMPNTFWWNTCPFNLVSVVIWNRLPSL